MTGTLTQTLPVIAIVGPTASGKTSLAQNVAVALDGEVLSADSMQIYRGMDIGTAKITPREMQVPHHFIDILEPGEAYSAQQFQTAGRELIQTLQSHHKVPIVCGGTGFYVQALLEDMQFPKGEQINNPIRERWQAYLTEHGSNALWQVLQEKDPQSAAVIHPNNSRRVIRALEMFEEGVSYAQQSAAIKRLPEIIPSLRYGIALDRAHLYERINTRVDKLIELGLVGEVNSLLRAGFRDALTAQQAIGYKEIVRYVDGACTLQEAIDDIKQATRRYAKRQMSWFKRDQHLRWLDGETLSEDAMAEVIINDYREQLQQNS